MKVEFTADYPINEEACREATGRTKSEWFAALKAKPELTGKRRETISWLYEQMNKNLWWATTVWVDLQGSNGVVLKDGKPDGYNICSTKTISASVETVFAAFQDGSLESWFGDSARIDNEGKISDSNGNCAMPVRVRENKDLRYRWQTSGSSDETEVEVMFAEKAGKTGIILNHNRILTREEADGLRRSWAQAFDRLKSLIEGSKP